MRRIGIVAALPGELKPLVQGWERTPLARGCSYSQSSNDVETVAVYCGMGREAASLACMQALEGGPLSALVSIGWAGALTGGLKAGHSYQVGELVDASTGEQYWTEGDVPESAQRLVTANRVILKDEKLRLAQDFGAGLVDMEAATVARLARVRDIPFYCYKAVSDSVEEALPDMNPYILPSGQMRTGRFAASVLVKPQYWAGLVRMGKNSSIGATALADDVRKLQREITDAHSH